ncbi:MAG: sodium:alanine symporter family protein [Gammaproteobacteria bacterium AqS3]|nr:sodium:alanine symporter family protein [Gammaproteobacteria bacterium AqS3]
MQMITDILNNLDSVLGSASWFAACLLGTGLYFTIALKLPQFRLFGRGMSMLSKANRDKGEGDANTVGALSTALSGTIGTGNVGGVAFALFLGGPAALFWMWATAFLGMASKMVEVTMVHKYRDQLADGTFAGGTMYVLSRRLGMPFLGGVFAVMTILTVIGSGGMIQMRTISTSIEETFNIDVWVSSLAGVALLGVVIIGGVRRITQVATYMVPSMAIFYIIGTSGIIIFNAENLPGAIASIIGDVFTGTAVVGGFLGAGIAQAFQSGVARGLFSNEAGQGSAPMAHAMARTEKSADEGVVALLEPMIDTLIICSLTGLALLASGAWSQKHEVNFAPLETEYVQGEYRQDNPEHLEALSAWIAEDGGGVQPASGRYAVVEGKLQLNEDGSAPISILHSRSLAEDVVFLDAAGEPWSGELALDDGRLSASGNAPSLRGRSLTHSVPLTIRMFEQSYGSYGSLLVTLPLLLFAFSTLLTWQYYGDRSTRYLFKDNKLAARIWQLTFMGCCFVGGIADTKLVWTLSTVTQALMTLPNLFCMIMLRREIREDIEAYSSELRQAPPPAKK